ncbi:Rv2732c family membrane protein [Rhodococcus artemisiae]|uniref:Transmembrane protein n=1 Tax=Rhodococcus artemisiae TaxID=714159 RepID=A0ABU7L4A5_9NOCA|nr:hypothetical protein [Rhodococcus artemisiae]MEE2056375.1 hypothetical protein [Rhodococcus artemisiae]
MQRMTTGENSPNTHRGTDGDTDRLSDHGLREARADLEAAERRIAGEIDPGARAMFVAVAVLVLLGSFTLPHAGAANGWEVLSFASDATAESIALPSRIFTWLALGFGAVASILALVTRKWFLAWAAAAGSAVSIIFGLLTVWSRQTLPVDSAASGPGIGLFLGWLAVMVLTFHWVRVAWSRTSAQLAAEAELRRVAEEDDRRGMFGGHLK